MAKMRYIQDTGESIMVRIPGQKQKNFHRSLLNEAIAYRDGVCKEIGLDPYIPFSHKNSRFHQKSKANKKSDLPVGICITTKKISLVKGGEKVQTSVRAGITINGKTTYKVFSADKYGFDRATKMAILWRAKQMKKKIAQLKGKGEPKNVYIAR